jgi:putative transposase
MQIKVYKKASWGGRREGAGRKNLSRRVNHMARPRVDASRPMHVTVRLSDGALSLRRKPLLRLFASGLLAARKFGLRVNQFSILGNHLHLILEANDNQSLSRGMQSLLIRIGKNVARRMRELGIASAGRIFNGRYHLQILRTPQQMRNALRYVLLNESKHARRAPFLSIFSSNFVFAEWNCFRIQFPEREIALCQSVWNSIGAIGPLAEILSPPKSWLGRVGWRRA